MHEVRAPYGVYAWVMDSRGLSSAIKRGGQHISAQWDGSFKAQGRPYLLGPDARNARRSGGKVQLGT